MLEWENIDVKGRKDHGWGIGEIVANAPIASTTTKFARSLLLIQ